MNLFTTSFLFLILVMGFECKSKKNNPPHCTQVTKDTDYVSKYKLDYPKAYIPSGQHEAYQQMFCISPPAVNKAVTVVCDWAAPPQVQFTLGDDYMHVVRQDPTGRYLGNAIISTYQLCSHNISHVEDSTYVPRRIGCTKAVFHALDDLDQDALRPGQLMNTPGKEALFAQSSVGSLRPVRHGVITPRDGRRWNSVVIQSQVGIITYNYSYYCVGVARKCNSKSTPGEILSYVYTGVIQPFVTYYTLNVTPTIPGVQKNFTYLRVHHAPSFPRVSIEYDTETSFLKFYIKYPFSIIAFGVDAYSLPSLELNNTFKNVVP